MATGRRLTRQQVMNRREALKALAGIGGAAAASALVPEKWVKPVVEAGVLPAHAQSTLTCLPPYAIDRCEITNCSWSDHNNLAFTAIAYLSSACSDIPMRPSHEVRDVNLGLIEFYEFAVNILTQSQGIATIRIGIDFNHVTLEPYLSTVAWKFANPSYGTDTCTATIIYPPRPK